MKLKDLLVESEAQVSQAELLQKVKTSTAKKAYIKNLVGAIIPTANLSAEALTKIGGVDSTKYTPEYIKANPYTLVQFDAKTNKIDMYQPTVATLKQDYKEVAANDTITKNLSAHGLSGIDGTKFVAKKAIVMMASINSLGIPAGTVVESPWGTQTAEKDAYIVDGGKEAYVVNASGGLPIGYIPA